MKLIKIVLIGPESTGKSTLANQLAEHYNTVPSEEFAREYIDKLERKYVESDLLKIAKGQIDEEEMKLAKAKNILICDTDLIVIQIWAEVKYGCCDEWILEEIAVRDYDLYLLCGTDVPWEFDFQREHPEFRNELYQIYLKKLNQYNKKYIEIIGNKIVRLEKAIRSIDELFLN